MPKYKNAQPFRPSHIPLTSLFVVVGMQVPTTNCSSCKLVFKATRNITKCVRTYSSLTITVMFSLNPKDKCQKIIQSALDTAESGLNLLLQWTKTTDKQFTKQTTTTLQTFLTTVQTTRFLRLILAKTTFTGTRPNCTNPTYGNTISQLPHMYVYTLQTHLNYLFSVFELDHLIRKL